MYINNLEQVIFYRQNILNKLEISFLKFFNSFWKKRIDGIFEKKILFEIWNPYYIYNLLSWKFNFRNRNFQWHSFHLVSTSYWPITSSIFALNFLFGLVMWIHNYKLGGFICIFGIISLIIVSYAWWKDVIREGTFFGFHTLIVKKGLRIGMILFIISEIMFFFSFFWAFFHSSLNPSIVLGSVWPPIGINVIDPMQIPLLNTLILLTSGISLTWSHHKIKSLYFFNTYFLKIATELFYYYPAIREEKDWIEEGFEKKKKWEMKQEGIEIDEEEEEEIEVNDDLYILYVTNFFLYDNQLRFYKTLFHFTQMIYDYYFKQNLFKFERDNDNIDFYLFIESNLSLIITILLGLEFTLWQFYEYYHATFYLFDGIYGSTFYMTTGLHGFHVLIGTIFLIICLFRLINHHFNWKSHVGYESAIWYWHFVDVVWIIVFSSLYCWGTGIIKISNFYKN